MPKKDYNNMRTARYAQPPGACLHLEAAGLLTGYGRSHYAMVPSHFGPHVILRGRGVFSWPEGETEVGVGSVFALLPGMRADYREDPKHPWQYRWLHIEGSGMDGFARGFGFTRKTPVWQTDLHREIARRMKEAFDCLDPARPAHVYTVQEKLYRVAELCAKASRAFRQPKHERNLVERVKSLIDSQLHTAINVTELAAALNVSRTTLFYAFRNALGLSPVQWLRSRRIERAKDLLRGLDEVRISSIATSCGFADEKYFMRAFKQQTGRTPSDWRSWAMRRTGK